MNCSDLEPYLDELAMGCKGSAIPDEAGLRRHLAECPACQLALRSNARWDRHVGRAMSDVALPDGMTDRLVSAIRQASLTNSGESASLKKAEAAFRFRALMTVVIVIFSGASLWWTINSVTFERLSDADVVSLWEARTEPMTSESKSIRKLPQGWSSLNAVSAADWKQVPRRSSRIQVSVKPFEFRSRRGSREQGALFAIPRSHWTPAPSPFVSHARIQYSQNRVWMAWGERDLVYLVVLEGSPESIEQIRSLLDGGSAVF